MSSERKEMQSSNEIEMENVEGPSYILEEGVATIVQDNEESIIHQDTVKESKEREMKSTCASSILTSLRKPIWMFLEKSIPWKLSLIYNIFAILMIWFSIVLYIISTEEAIVRHPFWTDFYVYIIEIFMFVFFFMDFMLRLWSCVEDPKLKDLGCIRARLKYLISFSVIVDVICLLSALLAIIWATVLLFTHGLAFFQRGGTFRGEYVVLRALRFLLLLRMSKQVDALSLFHRVFVKKRTHILTAFFLLFICVILVSTAMHSFEREVQPEHFGSIPRAFYYTFITLSTVGYGDVTPVTTLGKTVTCLSAILAISLFALPSTIFASAFAEHVHEVYEQKINNALKNQTSLLQASETFYKQMREEESKKQKSSNGFAAFRNKLMQVKSKLSLNEGNQNFDSDDNVNGVERDTSRIDHPSSHHDRLEETNNHNQTSKTPSQTPKTPSQTCNDFEVGQSSQSELKDVEEGKCESLDNPKDLEKQINPQSKKLKNFMKKAKKRASSATDNSSSSHESTSQNHSKEGISPSNILVDTNEDENFYSKFINESHYEILLRHYIELKLMSSASSATADQGIIKLKNGLVLWIGKETSNGLTFEIPKNSTSNHPFQKIEIRHCEKQNHQV